MRESLRRYGLHALLFVALALVAVLGWSNRSLAKENGELWDRLVRPYRGFVVPAFTARATDGREVVVADSDSTRSQVLFVFSKGCLVCTQTLATWRGVASALAGERVHVAVVGISLDSAAVAANFAADNRLPFPVVGFPDLRTKAGYRAREVPLTMVVDGRGRVVYSTTGLLQGRAAIDSVVTAASAAAAPRPSVTASQPSNAEKRT